jgi:hypothetical protein
LLNYLVFLFAFEYGKRNLNVNKFVSLKRKLNLIIKTFVKGIFFQMELLSNKITKYSFSGHDSFQCRQFWLKKGFDFVLAGRSFNDDNAVIDLGVGKNMVASIRFWLKAFYVSDIKDQPTDFGTLMFGDRGLDPFLEDDGSLWLLHYHLVKTGFASIYTLIFNELRREKIEFNKESFTSYVKRKSEVTKGINFNPKTVAEDFDVFRKMYLSNNAEKVGEDGYSGLLSELNLVNKIENRVDNKKEELFSIENSLKAKIPVEIFLYTILENDAWDLSINLNSLEQDVNSPGSVFAMSRQGIIEKIHEAKSRYSWLQYNDHAGVKELQLKERPEPLTILTDYYG